MKRRLACETLEDRRLLAIDWVNMGAGDNFDTVYGANAATARAIVQHAIGDWEAVIQNFNYPAGSPGNSPNANTYELTLSAGYLGSGVGGVASNVQTDFSGRPHAATITMDDNGGGFSWFLDTSITSDSEFDDLNTAFYGEASSGTASSATDFYTVVLHEIGHALGYISAAIPGGHTSDPNDLMHASTTTGTRKLIGDSNVQFLQTNFGYTTPGAAVNNLHVDTVGNTVNVRGLRGSAADTMSLSRSGSTLTTTVNGVTETSPFSIFSTQIQVNTGDGNDTVNVSEAIQGFWAASFSVDTGTGWDSFNYSQGDGTNYSTSVGFNSISRPYRFIGPSPYTPINFSNSEYVRVYGGTTSDDLINLSNSTGVFYHFIYGYGGNDEINANNLTTSRAFLYAGDGNDLLRMDNLGGWAYGQNGNDIIYGGGGADYIRGGNGNDVMYGFNGNDSIFGELGADYIRGGNGDDRLYDGISSTSLDPASVDNLYGEAGNDLLYGGTEDNLVS